MTSRRRNEKSAEGEEVEAPAAASSHEKTNSIAGQPSLSNTGGALAMK